LLAGLTAMVALPAAAIAQIERRVLLNFHASAHG